MPAHEPTKTASSATAGTEKSQPPVSCCQMSCGGMLTGSTFGFGWAQPKLTSANKRQAAVKNRFSFMSSLVLSPTCYSPRGSIQLVDSLTRLCTRDDQHLRRKAHSFIGKEFTHCCFDFVRYSQPQFGRYGIQLLSQCAGCAGTHLPEFIA